MPTDKEIEIRLAEKELLDATNAIRKIEGFPPLSELPEPPFCSFCGRAKNEVGALVEGHEAYICAECAAEARRLLLRE
jgi:hypothetical protein